MRDDYKNWSMDDDDDDDPFIYQNNRGKRRDKGWKKGAGAVCAIHLFHKRIDIAPLQKSSTIHFRFSLLKHRVIR